MFLESNDPLGDHQAGSQFLRIVRFCNKIIGAGVHRFEVAVFAPKGSKKNDVAIVRHIRRPNGAAEFDAVQFRHEPI